MSNEEGGTLPIGAWELVSLVSEWPDGSTFEPFGPRPSGRLIYDENGHVTGMIVGEQRNEATGNACPPEAQSLFTGYFGTYQVDVPTREIIHHVTTSLNGMQASGELRRNYKVEDNTLYLSFSRIREGVQVTSRLVWRRISPL
jgi:hypothetical protein